MNKRIVVAAQAPRPIGPYNQAVVAEGEFVFTAGQIGVVPASGEIVAPDVSAQTRQALENLKAVLEAAGSGLDHVVKTTVYLKDMGEFPVMNDVYGQYFRESPPARSTVEVARLPKDVRVEIDAVGLIKKG